MRLASRLALMAVVGFAACANEPSIVVDLGVIVAPDRSEPPIVVPAGSPAGTDIMITVMTYGDDCTWVDRTDVEVTGLHAIIRPFDNSAVDSVCADTLFGYSHAAVVRFEQPGTATITALGYAQGDRFGTVIELSSSLEIQ